MNPDTRSRPSRAALQGWYFTLGLLVVYVGLFHLWGMLDRCWVAATGIAAATVLGIAIVVVGRRTHYFVNTWDELFHGLVILDLLLESVLIGPPEDLSFYGCAIGFGVVIAGYRLTQLRRSRLKSAPR